MSPGVFHALLLRDQHLGARLPRGRPARELVPAPSSVGYLLVDGQTTSRPEVILGALLLFALLGKLSDGLLERLGRR